MNIHLVRAEFYEDRRTDRQTWRSW